MVLGSGALGRSTGHEGGATMHGFGAPTQATPGAFLLLAP